MKKLTIAAIAAASVLAPSLAAANCSQLPINQLCTQRLPGGQILNQFNPNSGGNYICLSLSGAQHKLQVDKFNIVGTWPVYECTRFRTCGWASSNNQAAHNKFC